MKNGKTIVITALITIVIMFGVSILSPYNILHRINANHILEEPGIKGEFPNEQVQSVTYKGDNTYVIKTDKHEYVAVREYFSLMNYKWKIYELKKEWG
ncbi:hypothetical protein ACFDTO_14985 [Microbacteriaceae bacterium 4G12]